MVPAVANNIISRAYSTPVGTIISLYGKTAPAGYLACDGATYNRDDYPDLAEYLVSQFEDLVGDGETTFKVPDLQGEFLRGTGTNGHFNTDIDTLEGSGSNVGEHQNSTTHVAVDVENNSGRLYAPYYTADHVYPRGLDSINSTFHNSGTAFATVNNKNGNRYSCHYTSRPTNTSVLYCIKY